ncbi:MAG TPA: hypothetical protein VGO47_02630 [Chlamydiales bacterium]|nr:hypothetical protein [Chlamydiales bacterium]
MLRESEKEQLAETRAALAVKKERSESGQDFTGAPHQPPVAEVCENLRTVQFEVSVCHL